MVAYGARPLSYRGQTADVMVNSTNRGVLMKGTAKLSEHIITLTSEI